MLHVVSMKVYGEDENGQMEKHWFKVKNGEEVLNMELCSGDKLLIDGIGNLEILGLLYKFEEKGTHPYRSLEITCGLITNEY